MTRRVCGACNRSRHQLFQNGHTDVVVITVNILHVLQELSLQVCVALGQGKNIRRIPVNDLYYRFAEKKTNTCSLSIHSLAAFRFRALWKGAKSAWQTW